jgi:hypothetical protein
MSSKKPPAFLRRINDRGEFESACPACFDVISTQADETGLAADEANHQCSEMILNETLDYLRSHLAVEERSPRRKLAAL